MQSGKLGASLRVAASSSAGATSQARGQIQSGFADAASADKSSSAIRNAWLSFKETGSSRIAIKKNKPPQQTRDLIRLAGFREDMRKGKSRPDAIAGNPARSFIDSESTKDAWRCFRAGASAAEAIGKHHPPEQVADQLREQEARLGMGVAGSAEEASEDSDYVHVDRPDEDFEWL